MMYNKWLSLLLGEILFISLIVESNLFSNLNSFLPDIRHCSNEYVWLTLVSTWPRSAPSLRVKSQFLFFTYFFISDMKLKCLTCSDWYKTSQKSGDIIAVLVSVIDFDVNSISLLLSLKIRNSQIFSQNYLHFAGRMDERQSRVDQTKSERKKTLEFCQIWLEIRN